MWLTQDNFLPEQAEVLQEAIKIKIQINPLFAYTEISKDQVQAAVSLLRTNFDTSLKSHVIISASANIWWQVCYVTKTTLQWL